MTKTEYLIQLAIQLQALTQENVSTYPEMNSMLEFYQEMLEDKIEDGMTEEDAVAAMETPQEIIARLKAEYAGEDELQPVMPETAGGEEGRTYSHADGEYTAVRREYDAGGIQRFKIEDSNHSLKLMHGDTFSVCYQDSADGRYEVKLEKGTLEVKYVRIRGRVLRNIFRWHSGGGAVVVEIPESWHGSVIARTSNSAVSASSIAPGELEISSSNGAIALSDISSRSITAATNNGGIRAEELSAGTVKLKTSNGRIDIREITARDADAVTSNGMVHARALKVNALKIKSSNGAIRLTGAVCEQIQAGTGNAWIHAEDVNAGNISLTSSNGAITGVLPGTMGDYAITSSTSNNTNNLPNGTTGEKRLDVRTTNAKIDVRFAG